MNGKRAKHLRRSAAYITDLPTSYGAVYHRKKGMFPYLGADGAVIRMEEKEYQVLQVKLGNCTRQVYQMMKRFPMTYPIQISQRIK